MSSPRLRRLLSPPSSTPRLLRPRLPFLQHISLVLFLCQGSFSSSGERPLAFSIEMITGFADAGEQLLSGRADIAFSPVKVEDSGISGKLLFKDPYICLMDKSNPLAKDAITVDEFRFRVTSLHSLRPELATALPSSLD